MKKLCLILFISFFIHPVNSTDQEPATENKLLGFKVSTGAAAGYIEDAACKTCHIKHWEGYQEVGMSHSFLKPKTKNFIENFEAPVYFHQPSQRYYKIEKKQNELFFYRYQLDQQNQKINEFRQKVDWLLGSGNKARSYLYQNASGEIYQFPIGWYSETKQWRMSPGFESSEHYGLQRQVRRECMFCHNAFPNVPEGSDSHWQPHLFPNELPLGTGCQRCHGPGAKHIQTIIDGGSIEQIHDAIVNPAKLPVENRDSVCFQCHLLPSVAVIGTRIINRNDYSFRPGQLISDYLVHVDIDSQEQPSSERFEINHHAYRLRQSECFIKSEGKLTCISCHNPHKKVKSEQKIKHFGSICLDCHKKHVIDSKSDVVAEDCTSCHMPQRRTQDVIEVVMTDHKIQKNIASKKERFAPLKKKEPIIESIDILINNPSLGPLKENLYTTVPLLRALTSARILSHYQSLLSKSDSLDPLFYMDLAKGQIDLKQFNAALKSLQLILNKDPNNYRALQLSAVASISIKDYLNAEALLNKAYKINPNIADLNFNFALLYIATERNELAAKKLQHALKLKPTLTRAWYYSGYLNTIKDQHLEAIENYKKALEIEPSYQRAYLSIAQSFIKIDQKKQALRYINHGIKVTKNSTQLKQLRNELTHELNQKH